MTLDRVALRAQLEKDRLRAVELLRSLGASFDDIVAAARDSNLDDEHDPEGSTIAVERSMVSSMASTTRSRLDEIDAALQRLADDSFGSCAGCGQPIPEGRLEARPTATRCVSCTSRAT